MLSRGGHVLAVVRVDSLEDANRLETIAILPAVYGVWRPHYVYEGPFLSVSEFEALVGKNPHEFKPPRVRATPTVKGKPAPVADRSLPDSRR